MNRTTIVRARARQFAPFAAIVVGLATSGCITQETVAPDESDEAQSAVTVRARMVLDEVRADERLTGSVCADDGGIRCFAHAMATRDGFVEALVAPGGLGAIDLQAAYKIPATIRGTPTIAIVDAYGYPQLAADLALYRTQYGLPACTIANGCLRIVNQDGGSTLPPAPPATDDWTLETALDLDMASAACPACKLLVVQAQDASGDGLYTAQNTAAALGASVVSNSWGGPEQAGASLATVETYFAHPNVAIFVAAGDNGYNDAGQGPDYPGTSAHVIAVGGTRLVRDASARGWTETAWANGGSACSLSIAKPAYQSTSACAHKVTTDIAAVGDPQSGVAVYNARNGGWTTVGGTSASAPLVAAIFAATGNGAQTSGQFVRDHADVLYDVTSGKNGTCTSALCAAGIGWDGPTGYGTPNATALVASAGENESGSASDPTVDTMPDPTSAPATDGTVTGGCSATNGGSGLALIAIGFCVARGRRRRR